MDPLDPPDCAVFLGLFLFQTWAPVPGAVSPDLQMVLSVSTGKLYDESQFIPHGFRLLQLFPPVRFENFHLWNHLAAQIRQRLPRAFALGGEPRRSAFSSLH